MPLLEVTDLCGVLASLDDLHSWYVYAMIDQRRSYNMELLHSYCKHIVLQELRKRQKKSHARPYKVQPNDMAEGITKAALYAHFYPKGTCAKCKGLGFSLAKKCDNCGGKGVKEVNWAERVAYGFPMRPDLCRKWYIQSCEKYDRLVGSVLIDIQLDLVEALKKAQRDVIEYQRESNEKLF